MFQEPNLYGFKLVLVQLLLRTLIRKLMIMDDKIFKSGFQLGAMLELPVTNLFSVIPGLILQTKGYSEGAEHPISQINWKTDYNFWYFDIPVLLNLKIPIKKSGLFIEIGPYAGIGLSGNVKYYGNTNEPFNEKDKLNGEKMKMRC
jgi:hypothetical protein